MWAISHVKAMKIRWHSLVNDTNFDGNKQIRKKPFVIKHRKCIILIQANNKSTKILVSTLFFSRLYLLMSSLNFALSSHNPPKSVQKCRFSFAFYFPINERTQFQEHSPFRWALRFLSSILLHTLRRLASCLEFRRYNFYWIVKNRRYTNPINWILIRTNCSICIPFAIECL